MELFNFCILFVNEYTNIKVKNKIIKEKYKIFINNLSILFSETSLEIHNYISIKYDFPIVINILIENNTISDNLQNKINSDTFDDLLRKFKENCENIQIKKKYISNTRKNLSMNLFSFLTDKKNYLSTNGITIIKKKIIQEGKYFKRWILLSKPEQIERFESYIIFYINKNEKIDQDRKDYYINKVNKMVISAFEKKEMIYRDYTWNTTKGLIENIKILRFNDTTKEFALHFSKIQNKGALADKERKRLEKENGTLKKKISTRTIINIETEKIINEELLMYIFYIYIYFIFLYIYFSIFINAPELPKQSY